MTPHQTAAATACLHGAELGTMDFPAILGTLADAGIEAYAIDFRRAAATYYLPDGTTLDLPAHRTETPIAAALDPPAMQAAIREAQSGAPGYTYAGFRIKAARAGCAGYLVSLSGRRVLYVGRDGATHVEMFP